jgi:hypothetical protein
MPITNFVGLKRMLPLGDLSLLDLPGKRPKTKGVQCNTPMGAPLKKRKPRLFIRHVFPPKG